MYNYDDIPEKSKHMIYYTVYFIVDGTVSFKSCEDITFLYLKEGSYFGEIEILDKNYRFIVINLGMIQLFALLNVNF